jgi:hypothetical protein
MVFIKRTIVNPCFQINLGFTFVLTSSCSIYVVVLCNIVSVVYSFPIDKRFANKRYAPGTPAGNSLKKLSPV